jgi:SAM-dependent methyltransferase
MDVDDLVRDTLAVNRPYEGLVAEAYDTWLPVDGRYFDREIFAGFITAGGGPALELGCGNGRLLVGYVSNGLEVEGVDSSADMLALCRANADARGVSVITHCADWSSLALTRRFATVYNPAGSFALIDDPDEARRALDAWVSHLLPGGRLIVTMGVPAPGSSAPWSWRVRRSATRASDGITFMVHEAVRIDPDQQVQDVLNRHELWDANGSLVTTFIRRYRLRWSTRAQLVRQLSNAGLVDVTTHGEEGAFLAVGTRAG